MHHSRSRILPHTPRQLFDLVGDVVSYPLFLPWITAMEVSNRREESAGIVVLDARAKVRYSILRESFATRVRLDRPGLSIDVQLISGPFRKLENHWRFTPHPGGAQLTFDIDFEFGSRLLEGLFAANFQKAVASIVKLFEARAKALYG